MRVPCLKCGAFVERRDVTRHRDTHRGTAAQRGYDGPWQKLRAEHLAMESDCRFCGAPATDVDHILPKPAGPDEHWNLRSLCHSCHSRRTMTDTNSDQ